MWHRDPAMREDLGACPGLPFTLLSLPLFLRPSLSDSANARQQSVDDFATARGEERGEGPVQPQSGAVHALQPRPFPEFSAGLQPITDTDLKVVICLS
jgi:hypothetical protein